MKRQMVFVDLHPTSLVAEGLLIANQALIRTLLRKKIHDIWDVPHNGIIIVAHKSTVQSMDQVPLAEKTSPDLLIKINTSGPFQDKAADLRDAIVEAWKKLVACWDNELKAEVWIDFFHTWGATF